MCVEVCVIIQLFEERYMSVKSSVSVCTKQRPSIIIHIQLYIHISVFKYVGTLTHAHVFLHTNIQNHVRQSNP